MQEVTNWHEKSIGIKIRNQIVAKNLIVEQSNSSKGLIVEKSNCGEKM